MQLSPKQRIYVRILEEILPYIRNLQTHSFWRRIRYGSFFAELELVHNVGSCVANAEFTKADVYWLNSQAQLYVRQGRRDLPFYESICDELDQLGCLVPAELRAELTWNGSGICGVPHNKF